MARKSRYENLNQHNEANVIKYKVGLYIRLSREDGDKIESESVISQKEMLERYVLEQPDMDLVDMYIDDGYSGTTFDRPEFKRMSNDIGSKKINCIVVKDLSRFGRNKFEACNYIEVIYPMINVRFISLIDDVDTLKPKYHDNLLISFKNIVNDEYSRDLSQKVQSGFDIKRKQGLFIGAFPTFGYLKDPNDHHKLIVDEVASKIVKRIFELSLSGFSDTEIAKMMNKEKIMTPYEYKKHKGIKYYNPSLLNVSVWHISTITRILENRIYTGDMVQGIKRKIHFRVNKFRTTSKDERFIVENTHEAIISKEDFEKVQKRKKSRYTNINEKSGKEYILNGLVCCGDCGYNMRKSAASSHNLIGKYYFFCPTYRLDSSLCTKHSIRNDILEDTVFNVIKKYIEIAINMDNIVKEVEKKRPNINTDLNHSLKNKKENERRKLNLLLNTLYISYKNGEISAEDYRDNKNKIETEIENLNNEIIILSSTIDNNDKFANNKFINSFLQYKDFSMLTQDMAKTLINKIKVFEDNRIEIEMKFKDEFENAVKYIEDNSQ